MHHGRLIQPNAAGVLHDQHAQTHQRIGQIGVLVLGLYGIGWIAFFGVFQMVPDAVDGFPLAYGVFNSRLCLALILAGNLW